MGRAQKKSEAGSAGRLAAGRRPTRGVEGKKKAGNKKKTASPVARLFKLVVLLLFMAVLGFAIVLVVDVGASLLGSLKFGQVTFGDLAQKVGDRVLDRDVPEPKKKQPPPAPAPAPVKQIERAPVKAPSPEDYARHVAPRKDPEVEQAQKRLDELLRKL